MQTQQHLRRLPVVSGGHLADERERETQAARRRSSDAVGDFSDVEEREEVAEEKPVPRKEQEERHGRQRAAEERGLHATREEEREAENADHEDAVRARDGRESRRERAPSPRGPGATPEPRGRRGAT